MYYSTCNILKSHTKSSQADFLYSSVLLKLTACLLYSSSLLLYSYKQLLAYFLTYLLTHSFTAHLWRRSMDTAHRKHMSCDAMQCCVTSQRMRQLCGQKENMSRDHYLLLCDVNIDTKKAQLPPLLLACISGVA
jgi:hypothetical protein